MLGTPKKPRISPGLVRVVGEIGRQRVDRKMVGILVLRDQPLGKLPDGVVARQEHDTAPLQHRDIVALGREGAVGRLEIGRVVPTWPLRTPLFT